MAPEEALEIRKIIITVEVGHLLAVVDTRIRAWGVLSVVGGARIIHLFAEGDMMVVVAAEVRPRLVREMARWLRVSRAVVRKTKTGAP
jgi:hypothetical protein